MKITNAGGRAVHISWWMVRVERRRLGYLRRVLPWDRRGPLVLVGPRQDRHNPPLCAPWLGLDPITLFSLIDPVAEILGLSLPQSVRRVSRFAQSIMLGRIAREAFADEGFKSKKERRQERRRKR
ncbi:hypothetical protein LCGC14_2354710 [marine sediment metagenome]|uniref:Uncharacterized protein n=1 Tax=marine sediment metagenome TaxID=412755 RepID=A0A0F9EKW4_9ZZZZ